jgi:hypothetical protein
MRLGRSWPITAILFVPALARAQDDLSSGGLAPPPAIEPPAPVSASATEAELDQADKQDAGRGLEFFWFNVEGGAQYLGLQTFRANDLVDADVVSTNEVGPLFGAGVGVRLIVFTLGARFRLGSFQAWQLWTLNAELGMKIPLGAFEPYFVFGGGYASLGKFEGDALGDAGVSVRGFNVRGGFGLDYYVADTFSIGGNLSGDLLFLTRPKVDASKLEGEDGLEAEIYARDGSGIGAAGTLTVVAGLHF